MWPGRARVGARARVRLWSMKRWYHSTVHVEAANGKDRVRAKARARVVCTAVVARPPCCLGCRTTRGILSPSLYLPPSLPPLPVPLCLCLPACSSLPVPPSFPDASIVCLNRMPRSGPLLMCPDPPCAPPPMPSPLPHVMECCAQSTPCSCDITLPPCAAFSASPLPVPSLLSASKLTQGILAPVTRVLTCDHQAIITRVLTCEGGGI